MKVATHKMVIAAICAVMVFALIALIAVIVPQAQAQEILAPSPKSHPGTSLCDTIHIDGVHYDNSQISNCPDLIRDWQALPDGDESPCLTLADGSRVHIRKINNTEGTVRNCASGGGGGSSSPSTGAIVGIGVAVGVGVFVMSEMADKHGLLPRGFTPDFRFAMNDAKRPAVYIGNVYPLSDNQTLRFGISEVLNDDGDDFTIAAEWRLSL